MKRSVLLTSLVLLLVVSVSGADVRLPSVIGENMILQRDMEVPLWGWADPGEKVTMSLNGLTQTAVTNSQGSWILRIGPLAAGGPYAMTIAGNNTIVLENVMIGDVWICSGQSNMELMVHHCDDAENEVAGAYHPNIRLFQVKNDLSPLPLGDCEAAWNVCRPSTVGSFSAVGYYFGLELMKDLDVPIGLINSSWGGTSIEPWISSEAWQLSPAFKTISEEWEVILNKKGPDFLDYYHDTAAWVEELYYALATHQYRPPYTEIFGLYNLPDITVPESPIPITSFPSMPSWVNNAMIVPLVPFGIRGAIWYQGESNAAKAYQYRELFPVMIEDWRKTWDQGDFPFLFVQLANYLEPDEEPVDSEWAELREAQLMTLSVPNTGMAVTIDIGDANDIHPTNKQEVGRRLALCAEKVAFDMDVVHSGPRYDSMDVEDEKIRLRFTETGSGLMAKDGFPLRGFAIAGKNKKFVWAEATIENDEVVVWSDEVPKPVAVRYAWGTNPVCNLFNRERLPASPFRTDRWPGITEGTW